MSQRTWIAVVVVLCVAAAACGTKKADAIIIVKDGGNATVKGQVSFERDASGALAPNVWIPGNVVIFRVDSTVREQAGKAGRAYQIQKDLRLKEIGTVNPTQSDEEFATRFLANK
jgi:hypothetical protein